MFYVLLALFSGAIVLADQITKYLTVANIPLHGEVPFLPGFLCFTYTQNTGAAFSALEGQQWLFALLFVVLTLLIAYQIWKKPLPFTKANWWCIAAIYGGGLGNMIDRVRLGYVVDMIQTQFIRFPVFNVADCFVTCGCILLAVQILLFDREVWKEELK